MRKILTVAVMLALASVASAQVAINEVDYQNPGTDTTEWIELVGQAGTVLDGWTIELVNGNDSTVYGSYTLAGTIDNDFASEWGGDGGFFVVGVFDSATAAAFGAVDYTPAGWTTNVIQNGDPDGIRLKDAGGTVVDEIWYDYDQGLYDGAGDAGDVTTYSSIGYRGWSYGEPILVFDDPQAVGLDLNVEDNPLADNDPLTVLSPRGTITETSDSEWYWSGTSGYGADKGISPGLFNNASYGTAGKQDAFTVNIVPEPATMSLLAVGGLAALIRRRRK